MTNIWQNLNTVRIPKGIVVKTSNEDDYTQYSSAMCLESKTFYFTPDENNQITKVELNDNLLGNEKPITFEVSRKQTYDEK